MRTRKSKQTIKFAKVRADRMSAITVVQYEKTGRGAKRAGTWVK